MTPKPVVLADAIAEDRAERLALQKWHSFVTITAQTERTKPMKYERISLWPDVKTAWDDFVHGLGGRNSQVMEWLLSDKVAVGETPLQAGERLRDEFQRVSENATRKAPLHE